MTSPLVTLVASGVVGLTACGGQPATSELRPGSPDPKVLLAGPDQTVIETPVEIRQDYSYGQIVVSAAPDAAAPLIVTHVRWQTLPNGVKHLGAFSADGRRELSSVLDPGFPPRSLASLVRKVPRLVLRPSPSRGRGTQLLLGFRIDRPGRYTFKNPIVRYSFRGSQYEEQVRQELTVCADVAPADRPCGAR